MKNKIQVKAWAIGIKHQKPMRYIFSYDGEVTFMVFPSKKDAQIFRGKDKLMDIFKVDIIFPRKK